MSQVFEKLLLWSWSTLQYHAWTEVLFWLLSIELCIIYIVYKSWKEQRELDFALFMRNQRNR